MKKACPVLRFRYQYLRSGKEIFAARVEAVARNKVIHPGAVGRDRNLLGSITFSLLSQDAHTKFSAVTHISVIPEYKRCGIGTKLYEAAAKKSCEKFRLPLHSDAERTRDADSFWQKQVKNKRAVCIERAKRLSKIIDPEISVMGRSGCYRYRLSCPAPTTLANAKL